MIRRYQVILAALLMLGGGLFDLVDGVVARHHGSATRFGAFLDSTLDRLVVMEQGEIVEAGTHAELVQASGVYADLWARQSGGFLAFEDSLQERAAS